MSNTLHIIGVAHTIPNRDYVFCAFTSKIMLFPDVIAPFGWYVVEYSNEGSESSAHEHVVVLDSTTFRELTNRKSREDEHYIDSGNENLQSEFKRTLIQKLKERVRPGDIVCHVWGPDIEVFDAVKDCHHVELSVGYSASPGLPFRIFESSAWMHHHYGMIGGDVDGSNYKWVIPSAFDEEKWLPVETYEDYVLFHGRVTVRKGINVIIEIARRMPELKFRVCGPGDASPWSNDQPSNVYFEGPLFDEARLKAVQGARCILTPTTYIEPFGFSGIEAQLCGVPQIGSCFGAFHETIIEGVTGFKCQTLADWVEAVKASKSLDRRAIAELARERYSRKSVGRQYDWALRQLSDLSGSGWYGTESRKFSALQQARTTPEAAPKIWLFIPYFGHFPSYFDLYLESLERNHAHLRVVLLTDIDLTGYRLPRNLYPIPMSLAALRKKIAHFMSSEFDTFVEPQELLKTVYKLVDFKILYPNLFKDMAEWLGIQASDYVGWGDVDVIYGRFERFMCLDTSCEVIGGYHGHLAAVKNVGYARGAYRNIPNLVNLLLSEKIELTDEIAFRKPLLKCLEEQNGRMFYINRYFCDVVPPCFVDRFRTDDRDPESSFFDAYHPQKDIVSINCFPDGRLVVRQSDGNDWETIYCHLQKREMKRHLSGRQGFKICRDGFYDLDKG